MTSRRKLSEVIPPTDDDAEMILDVLEDVLSQACGPQRREYTEWDSMALSAYADGMRLLAERGRLRITHQSGRRVIAVQIPTHER